MNVRLPPGQLGPLDAWIEDQPEPKPSRPEAIRHLTEAGLRPDLVLQRVEPATGETERAVIEVKRDANDAAAGVRQVERYLATKPSGGLGFVVIPVGNFTEAEAARLVHDWLTGQGYGRHGERLEGSD